MKVIGPGSAIKQVASGMLQVSGTFGTQIVPVPWVDSETCVLEIQPVPDGSSVSNDRFRGQVSAGQVSIEARYDNSGSTHRVYWQVKQYATSVTVQRGTASIDASLGSYSVAVSPVDGEKTELYYRNVTARDYELFGAVLNAAGDQIEFGKLYDSGVVTDPIEVEWTLVEH